MTTAILKFDEDFVRDELTSMILRCAAARSAGGIALSDIVDGKRGIPKGWALDPSTCYYLPPDVVLL